MLELLTTFNVYCCLQKFTPWKLSIIKLCDSEKKHASPIINEFFYLSGSVSGFRIPDFPYARSATLNKFVHCPGYLYKIILHFVQSLIFYYYYYYNYDQTKRDL